MNSVSHVSANNGPSVSRSNNNNMSAFMYLAEALESSAKNAKQLFDSRSPEEKEKQAILQELKRINDLDKKQTIIKYLMKAFGNSNNSDLVAWLGGLNDQIQGVIDDIKKILSKIIKEDLKDVETEDRRSKHWWSGVCGDGDRYANPQITTLANKRSKIIDNIKELLSGSASLQNLAQLQDQFSQLATVISSEQKDINDGPFGSMAKYFNDKLNKYAKKEPDVKIAFFPKCFKTIGWTIAKLTLEYPAKIGNFLDGQDFIQSIWNGSNQLIKDSSFIVNEANLANQMLNGHNQVDINKLSSLIQKDKNSRNNYNNLMKNSLTYDSKLIAKVNYSNKV